MVKLGKGNLDLALEAELRSFQLKLLSVSETKKKDPFPLKLPELFAWIGTHREAAPVTSADQELSLGSALPLKNLTTKCHVTLSLRSLASGFGFCFIWTEPQRAESQNF